MYLTESDPTDGPDGLSAARCFQLARSALAKAKSAKSVGAVPHPRMLDAVQRYRVLARRCRAGMFQGARASVLGVGNEPIRVLRVAQLSDGSLLAVGESGAELGADVRAWLEREKLPESWARHWYVLVLSRRHAYPYVTSTSPKFTSGASPHNVLAPSLDGALEEDQERLERSFVHCQVRRVHHRWYVLSNHFLDAPEMERRFYGPAPRAACLSFAHGYDQRKNAAREEKKIP